jgi:phosphoglycolate phosphatase-like HAD superfamily hydrolase
VVLAFDFDGVLVNTLRENIDAINAYAARYEFPVMDEAAYVRMLDANFIEYWHMLLGARARDFLTDLHHHPRPHPTLLPEMRELLLEKKPVIVSSNYGSLITAVLAAHGVTLAVYGAETDSSKIRKLTRLKACPNVFVTDTAGDIIEGRSAGYTVIAVTWGFSPRATLEKAQPHHIVHTPRELREHLATLTSL